MNERFKCKIAVPVSVKAYKLTPNSNVLLQKFSSHKWSINLL